MAKKNNQKDKQGITNTPNVAKEEPKKSEERRKITMMEILSVAISGFALIVSIIAVSYSTQYSKLEYDYKVDPKIKILGAMEILPSPFSGEAPLVGMSEIEVSVIEKNNLNRAFTIHANNSVEKLELDNLEGTLAGKIKSGLDTKADIVSGVWEYRYFFLYLESLDGECTLYLIYTKSTPGNIQLGMASGIEVYGLEKAEHENDEDYVGEKLMAQKYVQLLKELPDYLCK